jgi:branched-chain amino acid transport system ATP-binding protein
MLQVRNLYKSFGGVAAIQGVSFDARPGEIVVIIGPNGAGKTTLFGMISGFIAPDRGEIWFDGHRLDCLPPHKVARLGVARTFQNAQILNMTVLENVMMGRYRHERGGLLQAALGLTGPEERRARREAMERLRRVGLIGRAELPASSLALGEQRLLELARTLASEPRLLLLDEPAAGLNAVESVRLAATVSRMRANEVTILLVEHDMELVMSIADRVVVLNQGQKLAEGRPEEVQRNRSVIEAYLGQDNGDSMAAADRGAG